MMVQLRNAAAGYGLISQSAHMMLIAGGKLCWRLATMSNKAPVLKGKDKRGISMVCSQASSDQWHGVGRDPAQAQSPGPRQG